MLQPIQEALRRNDNDSAIRLAKEALKSLPSSPDLLHLLAVAQLQKGLIDAGEESLAQAIALAPERGGFYVTRAETRFARGDANAAHADLSTALSHDPNQLAAYIGLARIELGRGQLDAAENRLKLARRIDAEHPSVLRIQGQIALSRNDTQGAIGALNRAAQLQPNNADLHFELGMAFQRHGIPAVAAQALRNAVKLNPNLGPAQRMLVTVLLDADEPEAARKQLIEVLKHQPGDAGGWGLLGGIELGLGNVEAAEQATLQSLVIQPEQPLLVSRVVELWARAQQGARARAGLDAVLAHQPQSNSLWSARFGLDALNDAGLAVLERWRAALPNSPDADEAEAQRAEALGDADRAEEIARAVLQDHPDRVGAALVLVRIDRQRAPEAAVERLAALSKLPLGAGMKRSIASLHGSLLDQLNRTEEALSVWQESVRVEEGGTAPGLPLPGFLQTGPELAEDAPRGGDVRLLWALPGTPAVAVFNALGQIKPVLIDRFNSEERRDGLGPLRPKGGDHGSAGAAGLWREQLAARGWDAEGVIDALPHCDAALLSALPQARLLALIDDPRDLLLGWLAFGSVQGYAVESPEVLARWLAEACSVLIERRKANPERTAVLKVEALQADAAAALAGAARFLGFEGEAGAYAGAAGSNSNGLQLPAGRWRAYSGVLGAAFDHLSEVAQALGYEA